MVSSVNLGSFVKVDGKTVGNGIISGLDSNTFIEGAVEAKRLPAVALEEKLEENSEKVTAFSELKTILTAFESSVDLLRNPPGVNNATSNIFENSLTSLTSNNSNDAANYLGTTAAAGAQDGIYELTITNMAEAKTERSIAFTSKTTSVTDANGTNNAGRFSAGTFTIDGESVTIQEGDSLEDIAASINSVNDQTGVTASIIQVSSSDFRLMIKSDDTGTANAYTLDDAADDVFTSTVTLTTTQAAEDAGLTLDGLAITRSSNVITDVIDDLTFSLFQETDVGQTITLNVSKDTQSAKDGIINFINAYNDFRVFVSEQTFRNEEGVLADQAILNGDTTLNNIVSRIDTEISHIVEGITAGNYSRLTDIGISFTDFEGDEETVPTSNILTVDQTKLDTALANSYDQVRKVFEFDVVSDSSKIDVFSRTNALDTTAFTVAVDVTKAKADIAQITYSDGGTNTTVNGTYTVLKDKTVGYDITDTSILGASTTTESFTTATDGDQFQITLTQQGGVQAIGHDITDTAILGSSDATTAFSTATEDHQFRVTLDQGGGTTTNYDFTFKAAPAAAGEFSTLTELASEINDQSTLNASVVNNRLVINAEDSGHALSFSNVDATDFRTALGVTSTTFKFTYKDSPTTDGDFNTLQQLSTEIDEVAGIKSSIVNNQIVFEAEGDFNTLSFANLNATDFVAALNVSNTTVLGGTITAPDDSKVEGLKLIYSGDGTDSVNVTVTQGIADRLYNSLGDSLLDDTGMIDLAIQALTDAQDDIQDDIDRIDEIVERYRDSLERQFAALEEAIAGINNILQLLEAQTQARNNANS